MINRETSPIVVIEDYLAMRTMLVKLLRDSGFKQIIEAENAKQALPLLKNLSHQAPIQAIICDLHMPDLDGIEVFKVLKLDSKLKVPPFILLAEADDLKKLSGISELGLFDVLIKPFNLTLTRHKLNVLRQHARNVMGIAA